MNIKKDFAPSDRPSAIDAMDHGMSYLWQNFIDPKEIRKNNELTRSV